ncbi:MAG: hypothetical protein GXO89_17270, partial [Chlorobi bacterium]|nr:hypothetical protein [Chlorobiota bacterium]
YSNKWGLLFIGTQRGLSVYNGENFQNFNKENAHLEEDPYIFGFIEQGDMVHIYTFSNTNFTYYPKTKTFAPKPENLSYSERSFISCFIRQDGISLLAYRNGLITTNDIDTLQDIKAPVDSPGNSNIGQVFGMAEDNYQNIWLASWDLNPENPGGLFLFDGEKIIKQNKILGKDPTVGWAVSFDKENNILWFGSLDMGLFMVRETQFKNIPADKYGLKEFDVMDLSFDNNGNLIILNKKNLVIAKNDNSFVKIMEKPFYNAYKRYLKKANKKGPESRDFESFKKALEFRGMVFQNDSFLWLWLSSYPAIFEVNLQSQNVSCFAKTGYGAGHIYFDEKGRLCHLPYWGSLGVYEDIRINDETIELDKSSTRPFDISDHLSLNGETWTASTFQGLLRGRDTIFVNISKTNTAISKALNVLCVDDRGHLIIGANNGDVYICRPKKDTLIVQYTLNAKDGILGNSISWLEVDKFNQLWIGTNTGLNRIGLDKLYDNDSLQIIIYDEKEGYSSQNEIASQIDGHGYIWLGTEGRLTCLHIAGTPVKKTYPQKVQLQKIEINGTQITEGADLLQHLRFDENYLHFYFGLINFVNPEKDQFRYFLDGLDLKWSDFSGTRQAIYQHLPPGKYIFRVEGKNLNTGLEYLPLEIKVNIQAPLWKTWWFMGILMAIVLVLVSLYFKYKIDKTKKKEQKKGMVSKQIAELEMKALLAQMNPHFTFNAINSIQNYILDNDVDKALSYLSDFSKIIRQTLENATKEFISLQEEIEYLERYLVLEQMRFDNNFFQQITIDPAIDTETTLIPPMILQPYVENAIKHGLRHRKTKGKLSIRFSVKDTDTLSCVIEDNGIGRNESNKINKTVRKDHNGAGMAITENRVQKLREIYENDRYNVVVVDLYGPDLRPQGTRVEVCLPLTQVF